MTRKCRIGGAFAVALVGAALLLAPAAFAQDAHDYPQVYKFPKIEPELTLSVGYGHVFESGSPRAAKYRFLEGSPLAGVTLVAFPFPHRGYLELDFTNKNDYFADIRYAYKDLVLTRLLSSTSYHNLDNITLVDVGAAASGVDVLVRDAGRRYGLRTSMNSASIRLKPSDYPFHVYLHGRLVKKKGERQQIFLGGDGQFTNTIRTSQKIDVDYETQDVTVGLNSHLGVIEADFSHSERRFRARGDRVMTEAYTAIQAVRLAGTYPHSMVPDVESSTNTLKLHTSYTGKIVGAFTISRTDSLNTSSGAAVDYLSAAADLRLMPVTALTFTLRYRHREKEAFTPSALSDRYYGLSTNPSALTGIRAGISTKTDLYAGNIRLRVSRRLTFNLGFDHKRKDRKNYTAWGLPPSTTTNTLKTTARLRLGSRLKLNVSYRYRATGGPETNAEPERGHKVAVGLDVMPSARVSLYLNYDMMRGSRSNIALGVVQAGNVTMASDRLVTGAVVAVADGLTVNASYAFMRSLVRQDHLYGAVLAAVITPNVRYSDSAHSIAASVDYSPTEKLTLMAGGTYTRSRGDFAPDSMVASFSRLDMQETVYVVGANYRFPGDWTLRCRGEFMQFNNLIANPASPGISDGRAQLLFVSLAKQW